MLTIFENAISDNDIEYLIDEFKKLKQTYDFKDEVYYIEDADTIKDVYHLTNTSIVQQNRHNIKNLPMGEKVKAILQNFLPDGTNIERDNIWASSADFPIGIHADVNNSDVDGNTYLIPLTFNDNIKTIIWKPLMGLNDLDLFIKDFANNGLKYPKKSNTTKEVDVEHCWLGKPSIANAMELDGIAVWKKGSIIRFDRRQPHASNNWKLFVDTKQYIVIHAKD
jgi:hypothetical protein